MAEDNAEVDSQEQLTEDTQEQSATTESSHNFDAGLSKLQARIGQIERDGATKSDIGEIKELLEGGREQPASSGSSLEEDELAQVGTIRGVEQRILKEVGSLKKRTEEMAKKHEEDKFWSDFKDRNPSLNGRAILEDAISEVDAEYPGANETEKRLAIDMKFKQLTASRKASSTKQDKKPSISPRESDDGADIKPESAESAEKSDGVKRDRFGLPIDLF